jgi:hypothetical protein
MKDKIFTNPLEPENVPLTWGAYGMIICAVTAFYILSIIPGVNKAIVILPLALFGMFTALFWVGLQFSENS